MTTTTKPNTSFWIIAVIALLWNLMGVFQFLSATVLLDTLRETATAEQMAVMDTLPSWYAIVFAIAVFTGLLGAILLLVRRKIAVPVFLISLVAVLIQMGYWVFATEIMDVEGPTAIIMPLIVITIAIFLYYYSKGAAQKGWLR